MKDRKKRRNPFRPYDFSNRLLLTLIICAVIACMFSLMAGYLYSRSSVRGELVTSQIDAADRLLELRSQTELPLETIIEMTDSDSVTLEVEDAASARLTAEQWAILNSQDAVTITNRMLELPVTYVQVGDTLVCIHANSGMNVALLSVWRIALAILSYLLVMAVIGTLSMRHLARPIGELTAATRKVSDGHFEVRLPEKYSGEIGELMCAFNGMAEALGKTSYLQKDFIASISHEFKTPIAAIKGYTRLLQMPGLTDDQRDDYVRMIAEQSDRLSRMSQTMLRLVALEQQSAPVSMNTFRVDEQLQEVIISLQTAWESKEIDWQLDLSGVTVVSDEELLRHVWGNILQNAVKFSSQGGVIAVRCEKNSDGDTLVTIRDEGIGMDADTKARIFDRFYQADKSRSSDGIGLGLSLAQRIVDILGGNIEVESELGKGSTFLVTIPERLYGEEKERRELEKK